MLNEGSVTIFVPEEDVMLKEISLDPSNSTPLINRLVCNFVAVVAFPDKSPINFGAVTIPDVSTENRFGLIFSTPTPI